MQLLDLILRYPEILCSRDGVIDYFVDAELLTKEEMLAKRLVSPGKLFTDAGKTHYVTEGSGSELIASEVITLPKNFKLDFDQTFKLEAGVIANHKGPAIETTLGRFLLNYTVLVKTCGSKIPYINEAPWNLNKLEDTLAEEVIAGNLNAQHVYDYLTNIYSLTSLNDFCVPAVSEKAMTSNPRVNARRKELFEQYKDQLHDPKIMVLIENELIAMDKADLKGDMSNGFMISGKSYNVHRKRMFGAVGMIKTFGDDQRDFTFVKSNLNDGWDLNEIPALSNDMRLGSYGRAKDTALGGVETKILGRVFQDVKFSAEDCKTRRGLTVSVTEFNKHHYVHRRQVVEGGVKTLTAEDVDKLVGKTIKVRSPQFCATPNGYCYTCADERFKQLGTKLLNIAPMNISSSVMLSSMKAMHGTKVEFLELNDLNEFVV